ncbi:MAG: hypothetical protein NTX71_12380 [Candidatus Aureabacteria bacterium]|nr:hypothetical protein [Candidatus Auribacterota bacterium]
MPLTHRRRMAPMWSHRVLLMSREIPALPRLPLRAVHLRGALRLP